MLSLGFGSSIWRLLSHVNLWPSSFPILCSHWLQLRERWPFKMRRTPHTCSCNFKTPPPITSFGLLFLVCICQDILQDFHKQSWFQPLWGTSNAHMVSLQWQAPINHWTRMTLFTPGSPSLDRPLCRFSLGVCLLLEQAHVGVSH